MVGQSGQTSKSNDRRLKLMREIYEAPELNMISYEPKENLASSAGIGFGDMYLGNGMSGDKAPIESTDISFDF